MPNTGFKFKGYDFHDIVRDGMIGFGNYTKTDGTPLTYNANGTAYSRINPTPGDISQAFKINGGFPSYAANGTQTSYENDTTNTTITAPGWARSFKIYVKTRKGSTGPKYESTQGGQRGPNTGQAGNNGSVYYSNTYTPFTNKFFTLTVGNADNSFTGISQSTITMGANAGGHGQAVQEGHTAQASYYTGNAGPNSNAVTTGSNAEIYTTDNANYQSVCYVYWFS